MLNLFVIAGHGDGDNGACGNGYQEAERVRALAQRIKDFGGDAVILCDFNINAYKSNIIGKGLIPKDCMVLELHIDSHPRAEAKGGHVIINANFKADKYDEALAKMISEMFPGRNETIVGRTDLANVNRAAQMGYNYRLLECCFISNAEDIAKFNANIDELAKNILACYEISAKETPKPVETTAQITKKTVAEVAQEVLNGKWGNGEERKKKLAQAGYDYNAVQAEVNKRVTPTKKSNEEIAKEVIKGLWGNGAARRKRLTDAGYNYSIIQALVNKLSK